MSYIKIEKTIRKINAQFRNHDALSISKVHPKKEPLFFSFFPDVKYLTVGFCNKIIEEGMLSTDMLLSEVKAKILPNCYAKLCKCTLYKDKDNIPDYDEILKKLQLKSISYSTVSRWINYSNYKYCKNNQN